MVTDTTIPTFPKEKDEMHQKRNSGSNDTTILTWQYSGIAYPKT